MEVLEHGTDQEFAPRELCRVVRTGVIVTVPYLEVIRNVPCIHCCKVAPLSGHLNRYDLETFAEIAPSGWLVSSQRTFAHPFARRLAKRLPQKPLALPFLRVTDAIFRMDTGHWFLAVPDRHTAAE
jgi:hypothetical protein